MRTLHCDALMSRPVPPAVAHVSLLVSDLQPPPLRRARVRPSAPPAWRPARCDAEHPRVSGKYADLLQGGTDAQDAMHWSTATVMQNREASADGSVRTLVLSVADAVVFADGRRVRHVQESSRWGDGYHVPGQYVAVRYSKGGGSPEDDEATVAKRLFALACSPYDTHASSANLDASIVELLASRGPDADADEAALASLSPGAQIQVSDVLGRGYCSLFNSAVALQSALEEARPIILVAVGTRGIAPTRAALAWTPVLAHATAHSVTMFYVAPSPASAAYLASWDEWREAGVKVHPLYNGAGAGEGHEAGSHEAVQQVLEKALFGGEHGLVGAVGGDPAEAAVALSGVPGDVAAHLTRRLTRAGVASERLLFCDYF